MNESEDRISASAEPADLKLAYADLRRQGTLMMIGLVVISLIVTAYLGLQVRRTGKDLDVIRPNATQLIELSKKQEPLIQNFFAQIGEYAQKNPRFAQEVLAKYGLRINTNAQAAVPQVGLPGK